MDFFVNGILLKSNNYDDRNKNVKFLFWLHDSCLLFIYFKQILKKTKFVQNFIDIST